ncbi:type II toxin-antitoxin system VapC family toxin [Patescibacteria group bacterium]|nr:type II toxin-antitoxin system VapC family toxin [Patescibacteria group bacterium]
MRYQLDTDVIIYHFRGKQKLKAEWFNNNPAISVITLGELLYGTKKSKQQQEQISKIKNFIKEFNIDVISIDSKIIELYSQEKITLEKQGNKLDDFDLLIGATAKNKNLTLVTNNKKHFKRIAGLKLA